MINNVVLVGRLTKDPELRKTQNGKSVVSFTIAVNRKFKKEETDFIRCVAWNQTADFMANYLEKGALVGIEGNIQTGSYEDNGRTVYTTDVICNSVQSLESKKQREDNRVNDLQSVPYYPEQKQEEPTLDITSDDLPF